MAGESVSQLGKHAGILCEICVAIAMGKVSDAKPAPMDSADHF